MMIFSLLLVGATAQVKDCTTMFLGTCPNEHELNGVLMNPNVANVEQCQVYCAMQPYCKYWMFDKSKTSDGNCLLYNREFDNFLQQCDSVKTTPAVQKVCNPKLNTKRSACQRVYYGNCALNDGVAEESTEFSTLDGCSQFCETNSKHCDAFHYHRESSKCFTYKNTVDKSTCQYVYGPSDTSLKKCNIEDKWEAPTSFWNTKTGSLTSGVAKCPGMQVSGCAVNSNLIADDRGSFNFDKRETCEKECTENSAYCNYFMWDDNAVTGRNCLGFGKKMTWVEHVATCAQMGGDVHENNSTATTCVSMAADCDAYVDGDCYYTGNLLEKQYMPTAEECAKFCVVNKAFCKAWQWTDHGKWCRTFDSNAKVCTKHWGTGASSLETCGGSYTAAARTGAKPDPGFDVDNPKGLTSGANKMAGIATALVMSIASMMY